MEMVRAQVRASREEQRRKQKKQAVIDVIHKRIIAEGETLPPIMHSNRVPSRWSLISAAFSRNSKASPVNSQQKGSSVNSGTWFGGKGGDVVMSSTSQHKISRRQSDPGKKQ